MAKQTQAQRDDAKQRAHKQASLNGAFLRDSLDIQEPEDDAVAIATARAVSVLITLREMARNHPGFGIDTIQAAIDGFMEGANIETGISPTGMETYKRKAK